MILFAVIAFMRVQCLLHAVWMKMKLTDDIADDVHDECELSGHFLFCIFLNALANERQEQWLLLIRSYHNPGDTPRNIFCKEIYIYSLFATELIRIWILFH